MQKSKASEFKPGNPPKNKKQKKTGFIPGPNRNGKKNN